MITAADNLATAFNVTANNLTAQRTSLDQSVVQTVGQVNQLSQQIAKLNGQISNLENAGESAGTFVDQRTQLIDQLSGLVECLRHPHRQYPHAYDRQRLRAGRRAAELTSSKPRTAFPACMHIYAQNVDITNSHHFRPARRHC